MAIDYVGPENVVHIRAALGCSARVEMEYNDASGHDYTEDAVQAAAVLINNMPAVTFEIMLRLMKYFEGTEFTGDDTAGCLREAIAKGELEPLKDRG